MTELKRLFNNFVLPRIHRGELREEIVIGDRVPDPRMGEPSGTLSQIVEYWHGDERQALVHRYLRADGTLGASGLPDPKNIHHKGKRHAPEVRPFAPRRGKRGRKR